MDRIAEWERRSDLRRLNVRIDRELMEQLDEVAANLNETKSVLTTVALRLGLAALERKRQIAQKEV